MNDSCTKSAAELAGMVASGDRQSAEAVDARLARIEAATVTLADEARVAAAVDGRLPMA
jgi:hypothetical protein